MDLVRNSSDLKQYLRILHTIIKSCLLSGLILIFNRHCRQCKLTSQMNSFIYEVRILIFYTVELNTDFGNITKTFEYLRSQYSIQLYKILTDDSDRHMV